MSKEMKPANEPLKWLIVVGMFFAVYFGGYQGVEFAANIAIFFVWLLSITVMVVVFFGDEDDRRPRSWYRFGCWIGICLMMVGAGWFWTAGVYVVAAVLVSAKSLSEINDE